MKHTLFFLLAATAGIAWAAPRTLEQARALAQNQLAQHLSGTVELLEVACTPARAHAAGNASFRPFYTFNNVSGQGYVIISGSDLMPAVLGYADQGQLSADAEMLPSNMQSWLQYVAEVEAYLEANPEAASALQQAQSATPVAQLMTTTWGQDAPFNDQCPVKNGSRTVTGCMATSISQVLNQQKYPSQMVGSYSYNDHGTTRTLNFDEVSIDYTKLIDSYSRNAGTQAQREEVAKLMKSVGFACNMQYDTSSGAISGMGLRGLRENLGCEKAQCLERAYFSLDEWNGIIQSELQSGRAVVLNGHSPEGGHSFVLDAVDAQGLYHVNWGWDGSYNGYYDVSILLPSGYGTGATESNIGFIYNQDVFVNVCDPAVAGPWRTHLEGTSRSISMSKSSINAGQNVTVSCNVWNIAPFPFKGNVGVLLMLNGQEIDRQMNSNTTTISSTVYKSRSNGSYYYVNYGEGKLSSTYTLPSLADGEYQLYLIVQPEDSEEYDNVRVQHSNYSYRTLSVSGGKASVVSDKIACSTAVSSWNFETETMTTSPVTLTAQIENDGVESTAYAYSLLLERPDGTTLDPISGPTITLAPGEASTVSFDAKLSLEGDWWATLYAVDACNDPDVEMMVDDRQFSVALDPTRGATFAVSKKLELVSETLYSIGPAEFQITVTNTGASYDGQMAVRLYSSKTSTAAKYLIAEIVSDAVVASNSSQEIQISGQLNVTTLTADKATLYARPYYLYGDELVQLSNATTQVTLYKGEAPEGIESIMVDADENIQVFDMMGRRTNNSSTGIKIVNGEKQMVR